MPKLVRTLGVIAKALVLSPSEPTKRDKSWARARIPHRQQVACCRRYSFTPHINKVLQIGKYQRIFCIDQRATREKSQRGLIFFLALFFSTIMGDAVGPNSCYYFFDAWTVRVVLSNPGGNWFHCHSDWLWTLVAFGLMYNLPPPPPPPPPNELSGWLTVSALETSVSGGGISGFAQERVFFSLALADSRTTRPILREKNTKMLDVLSLLPVRGCFSPGMTFRTNFVGFWLGPNAGRRPELRNWGARGTIFIAPSEATKRGGYAIIFFIGIPCRSIERGRYTPDNVARASCQRHENSCKPWKSAPVVTTTPTRRRRWQCRFPKEEKKKKNICNALRRANFSFIFSIYTSSGCREPTNFRQFNVTVDTQYFFFFPFLNPHNRERKKHGSVPWMQVFESHTRTHKSTWKRGNYYEKAGQSIYRKNKSAKRVKVSQRISLIPSQSSLMIIVIIINVEYSSRPIWESRKPGKIPLKKISYVWIIFEKWACFKFYYFLASVCQHWSLNY